MQNENLLPKNIIVNAPSGWTHADTAGTYYLYAPKTCTYAVWMIDKLLWRDFPDNTIESPAFIRSKEEWTYLNEKPLDTSKYDINTVKTLLDLMHIPKLRYREIGEILARTDPLKFIECLKEVPENIYKGMSREDAIKYHRKVTGEGLSEAKKYIDSLGLSFFNQHGGTSF